MSFILFFPYIFLLFINISFVLGLQHNILFIYFDNILFLVLVVNFLIPWLFQQKNSMKSFIPPIKNKCRWFYTNVV
jgi:hypothetical protein